MLTRFQDRFERPFYAVDLLEPFFSRAERGPKLNKGEAAFVPALNVYESEKTFLLQLEVPGVSEKDIHVSVDKEVVEIRGERKWTTPEGFTSHSEEHSSYSFSRRFQLGKVLDAEQATAKLKDGILTLTIKKLDATEPRKIEVQSAV